MLPAALARRAEDEEDRLLSRIYIDVCSAWEQHYKKIRHRLPDWFEDRLQQAVVCADHGIAASSALAALYPEWVAAPSDPVSPRLSAGVASRLLSIENKYSRSLNDPSSGVRLTLSFWRQAALSEWLDGDQVDRALDSLVETVIASGTDHLALKAQGPITPSWTELTFRLEYLKRLGSGADQAQVRALPNRPSFEDVVMAADYVGRAAEALRSAPPGLWRFISKPAGTQDAPYHRGALVAPDLAVLLHRRLERWRQHNLTAGQRRTLEPMIEALRAAMTNWLDRGSGTLSSFDAFTKTAGQKAGVTLRVITNAAGNNAAWYLFGRGAP